MPTYEIHLDFEAGSRADAEDLLRSLDAVLREKGLTPTSPDLHRFYLRDPNLAPPPAPLPS
jgi:hypothetical protein